MLWLRAVTVFFVIIGGLSQTTVSALLPGGIVIIGGINVRRGEPSIETLGTPELPSFPWYLGGITVSIVGSTVYSCGGSGRVVGIRPEIAKTCYYLKAEDPTWHSIALPWPQFYHEAVTVQDTTIWFLQESTLYSYDTAKDNDQFREYSLGFPFNFAFCAVSNQSHTFIIGVGNGYDEVWVNRDPSKPTEWVKVRTSLPSARRDHACLWFGNDIFITGGKRGVAGQVLDSVDVLNVVDMTIRSKSPLVRGREDHEMAVLQGKPAVLGGAVEETPSDSIEVYEVKNNIWQILDYTMKTSRSSFGLAQYIYRP